MLLFSPSHEKRLPNLQPVGIKRSQHAKENEQQQNNSSIAHAILMAPSQQDMSATQFWRWLKPSSTKIFECASLRLVRNITAAIFATSFNYSLRLLPAGPKKILHLFRHKFPTGFPQNRVTFSFFIFVLFLFPFLFVFPTVLPTSSYMN